MAKVLTATSVSREQPRDQRVEIPDGGMPGLYLVVQPSGGKSWAVRYRFGGKSVKLTLNTYPALGLDEAREKAAEILRQVAAGGDPRSVREPPPPPTPRPAERRMPPPRRPDPVPGRLADTQRVWPD